MRYSEKEKQEFVGKKFNHLTIIDVGERDSKHNLIFLARCECGKITKVRAYQRGIKFSCGCRNGYQIKHGGKCHGRATPTYETWCSMKSRCLNPNDPYFYRYGGRGIKICERWINSFENFLSDMGERPKDLTIDRIDMNGNYEPGNCRWATMTQQNRNHPNVKLNQEKVDQIRELRNQRVMAKDIANMFGITRGHVYQVQHLRAWA